jgi:hypothetical protein
MTGTPGLRLAVGSRVRTDLLTGVDSAYGYDVSIPADTIGEVTRLTINKALVRFNRTHEITIDREMRPFMRGQQCSVWVNRYGLTVIGEARDSGSYPYTPLQENNAAKRKLGVKPAGDEFLPIDHPGIQWIFDDMGLFADEQHWCGQYDNACATLGLPGRMRTRQVAVKLDGFTANVTVEARSDSEAQKVALQMFLDAARKELDKNKVTGFTPAA